MRMQRKVDESLSSKYAEKIRFQRNNDIRLSVAMNLDHKARRTDINQWLEPLSITKGSFIILFFHRVTSPHRMPIWMIQKKFND